MKKEKWEKWEKKEEWKTEKKGVPADFEYSVDLLVLFLSKYVCSLEENIQLKDTLDVDEKSAHESVKLLLRKYERLRVQ